MERYQLRVLTKKHDQDGAHTALCRALALAASTEAIIEVWCGVRCVYAGRLAEIRFPE